MRRQSTTHPLTQSHPKGNGRSDSSSKVGNTQSEAKLARAQVEIDGQVIVLCVTKPGQCACCHDLMLSSEQIDAKELVCDGCQRDIDRTIKDKRLKLEKMLAREAARKAEQQTALPPAAAAPTGVIKAPAVGRSRITHRLFKRKIGKKK